MFSLLCQILRMQFKSIKLSLMCTVFGFRNFSQILIPLQSLMTVTLPPGEGMPSNHDPFPNTKAYIDGIEDTVSFHLDMR